MRELRTFLLVLSLELPFIEKTLTHENFHIILVLFKLPGLTWCPPYREMALIRQLVKEM